MTDLLPTRRRTPTKSRQAEIAGKAVRLAHYCKIPGAVLPTGNILIAFTLCSICSRYV
jgi:hypothetical protein